MYKNNWVLRLDEGAENAINEALGVSDKVKEESIRILHYIYDKIKTFKPDNGANMKITEETINVDYSPDFTVPVIIKVYWFANDEIRKEYRKRFPKPNPAYSKDDEDIKMEIDVINGWFDTYEFMYLIQHELHHGYQYFCKKRNGIGYEPNTPYYNKAIKFLAMPDEDERAAGAAVYLWGTHEMSAYENGIYARLMQNFKSKNKQPITNVIHETSFYEMYLSILNLQRKLIGGADVPGLFNMSFGMPKTKLLNIIGKALKKAQDIMAKAVAKAKIDYEEWIETNGYGTNSDPYEYGSAKPLTENKVRLY